MKTPLSSIPQLYRNVRRLTEIISVLSKYGLADWISRINVDFLDHRFKTSDGEVIARLSHAARVRMALTELGPTFIKLGQLLSTRADLVGVAIADELTSLQTQVPPDSLATIRSVIEDELERPLDKVFSRFDETPIAVASIGQVHRARCHDGTEVVVKVRRHDIEHKVETDLDIISSLAQLVDRLDDFKPYQPPLLARELRTALRSELDFKSEQQNLTMFRRLFHNHKYLRIPRPILSLCSSKVLTMEFLTGTKVGEVNGSLQNDRPKIARRGAQLYLQMIFEHGMFHADPHPGNILIQDDGKIGLLDFGLVGRLSESLRDDMQLMLGSIVNEDPQQLVRVVRRIGNTPADLDEGAISKDLSQFVSRYSTQELAHFETAEALREFLRIVRSHRIYLPADVATLVKVLLTLDGTARLLNPKFNLMQVMRPFMRRLMLRRLSPTRQLRVLGRFLWQVERLAESMPDRIETILEQIQTGKFDVHLDHRRLGPSVNRLVMGMMTSALFLGSALLLSYKVPPLLFADRPWMGLHQLSMIGLAGCLVSMMLGARLFWAVRKSGNLDQKE